MRRGWPGTLITYVIMQDKAKTSIYMASRTYVHDQVILYTLDVESIALCHSDTHCMHVAIRWQNLSTSIYARIQPHACIIPT